MKEYAELILSIIGTDPYINIDGRTALTLHRLANGLIDNAVIFDNGGGNVVTAWAYADIDKILETLSPSVIHAYQIDGKVTIKHPSLHLDHGYLYAE